MSFLFVFVSMPLAIFANTYYNDIDDSALNVSSNLSENILTKESEDEDSPRMLAEDRSLRDEYSKHYVGSDGKYYAVVFAEPVHYFDDHQWKDVDNTLSYDSKTKKYVSSNPKFSTAFADSASSNELVSISDGEYTLSWSIGFTSATSKKTISITNKSAEINQGIAVNADAKANGVSKDAIANMGKAVSDVRYNKVHNDSVDLKYSVLHGKVEEDIILSSPDAFTSYTLTVNTGDLIAVKNSENSISFVKADGEAVFTLAAPWMKDATAEVSDDIIVSVKQTGSQAIITYVPSAEWLGEEDRVYPVLIDPSFTTRFYKNNYIDTYVYTGDSASTTRSTENTMKVGGSRVEDEDNPGEYINIEYNAYVKILDIPDIFGYNPVEEATFSVWLPGLGAPSFNLYGVNGDWDPDTITFANQPSSTLIESDVVGTVDGTRFKYTFDIASWIFDQYYYSDFSAFWESDAWNGFKISYANPDIPATSQIISSENTDAINYRPVLTIKYDYAFEGHVESGAVYSIINSASNKYLTVHNGTDANGTNVYQKGKDNSPSQAFRFIYNADREAYTIRPICSSDGNGRVLNFSYADTIDPVTGYGYGNVNIASYSTAAYDDQEWLIKPVETGLYKIVSRADTTLALTAYGSSNGTGSGTSATSQGNVFVSEYMGLASQHWVLETGGVIVQDQINIKYASSFVISEGSTRQFICPVENYGDTVSWTTSFSSIATVDSNGTVTGVSAGNATVLAMIFKSGGPPDTYSVSGYVTLTDGMYYLNNKSNSYRMDLRGGYITEGNPLQLWNSASGEPTNRNQLFKIRYLGNGEYNIRSMIKSDMGLTCSGSSLVNSTIGYYDSSTAAQSRWTIVTNTNGYYIYNKVNNQTKVITSPATVSDGTAITMSSSSTNDTRQNWNITKANASYHGVDIRNSVDELAVGESFTFTASMYSSGIGVNGQNGIGWSIDNITGNATINESTGVLTSSESGTCIITATYEHGTSQAWYNTCIVTIYSPTDVASIRMTRDPTDEYTLCVSTLYNGEKYWYQIDDYGNHSDVLLLSDENIALLYDNYNDYLTNGGGANSVEYCVYQAKYKLDYAIADNQIYDVAETSDEYLGLWLFFSMLEVSYRQAISLAVQGVNTMQLFVGVVHQAFILAYNVNMLANAIRTCNAAQYASGAHAVTAFDSLTNTQAVSEGITDIVETTGSRPTWRQSEAYAAATRFKTNMGYKYNKSYIKSGDSLVKANYGQSGSVRPDFYNEITGHCVDVKNYSITTTTGRNNLVNNVTNQYNQRVNVFPANTSFEVVIDVRGQAWTQSMLDDITTLISQRTSGNMAVSFIK